MEKGIDLLKARQICLANIKRGTFLLWNDLLDDPEWVMDDFFRNAELPIGYGRLVLDRGEVMRLRFATSPREIWEILDRVARSAMYFEKTSRDDFIIIPAKKILVRKLRGYDLFPYLYPIEE